MTRISDSLTTVYVLLVYQPGSRTEVRSRRVALRPWSGIRRGRAIGNRRRRLRIVALRRTTSARAGRIEHTLHAYTRLDGLGRRVSPNVVAMPVSGTSGTTSDRRWMAAATRATLLGQRR